MPLNGRLPSSALGTIPGTSQRVLVELVPQTAALREAFHVRFGKPLSITDSYRPYSVQERIFRQRYTTVRNTGIDARYWNGRTWWRLPGTASASTPGRSNHGYGRAIDWASRVNIGGTAEQKWMVANAPTFGWVWPSWARKHPWFEPWHYEATAVPVSNYSAALRSMGIATVTTVNMPKAPSQEVDDMAGVVDDPKVQIALREQIQIAIRDLLYDAGGRRNQMGRNTDDHIQAYHRKLVFMTALAIMARSDPTGRQTGNALQAILAGTPVDSEALGRGLAEGLADLVLEALPDTILTKADVEDAFISGARRLVAGGDDIHDRS